MKLLIVRHGDPDYSIDSHPECDRCTHYINTVVDEIVLCFLAFVGA